MVKLFLNAFILLTLIVSGNVSAHSGRTNGSGCHNDNIRGGYHCHNKKTSPSPKYNNSTPQRINVTREKNYQQKNNELQCTKNEENLEKLKIAKQDLTDYKEDIKKFMDIRDGYMVNDTLWLYSVCQKKGLKYVISVKNNILEKVKQTAISDTEKVRELFHEEINKCR